MDFFSFLEVCKTPFGPMIAITEGGGFLVSYNSVPLNSPSNMCGILDNAVLFSSTGRQPRA